jgi:LmbE family N-acetylglucosaminyl deacetylase
MFLKNDRVLVVAPHPDDETIAMGGTIAKLVSLSTPVRVVFMSNGVTSRDVVRETVESRNRAARNAMGMLGVNDFNFFDFPDNRFDSVPILEIAKLLEREVSDFRPTVVFAPYRYDLNIDHQIASEATSIAVRPKLSSNVRLYLNYEILSSTGWNHTAPVFNPNVFVDIQNYWSLKLSALQAYGSEMDVSPSARSIRVIESLANFRGGFVGKEKAESFSLALNVV